MVIALVILIVVFFLIRKFISPIQETYQPKYIYRSPEQLADEYYEFRDHFKEKLKDMSHLTPSEADQELRMRKTNGESIPQDEFNGYKEVINQASNKLYQEMFSKMTAPEIVSWLEKNEYKGFQFTADTMILIGSKLKPYQESVLLKMLKAVKPEDVPNWIVVHKKKGFYFSDMVYQKAKEKYDSRNK